MKSLPRTPSDLPGPEPTRLRGPVSHLMGGVRIAFSRPRILVFLLLVGMACALPVALAVHASASEHLVHAVDPLGDPMDLVSGGPGWLLDEWRRADPSLIRSVGAVLAPLMFLAMLLGLVVTAGWMDVALHARHAHGLSAFLRGGGRFFFPFLRTWFLGLGAAAAVTWIFWSVPGDWVVARLIPEGDPDLAHSETVARWVENGREILYVLALLKLEIVLDLARASLVDGGRSSAVLAFIRGSAFWFRGSLRVFRFIFAGFALEIVWVAGLLAAVDQLGADLLWVAFLLPLGRIALRGARHAGLATLYAQTCRVRAESRKPVQPAGPFDDGTAWRTSSEGS